MFWSSENHPDVRNSDISVRQDEVRQTAGLWSSRKCILISTSTEILGDERIFKSDS